MEGLAVASAETRCYVTRHVPLRRTRDGDVERLVGRRSVPYVSGKRTRKSIKFPRRLTAPPNKYENTSKAAAKEEDWLLEVSVERKMKALCRASNALEIFNQYDDDGSRRARWR